MRVVFCTVPERELGQRIARIVVEERLAACAQLESAPIESCYRWQGQLQVEAEHRLLIKTVAERLPALRARIEELHSYSVPQIVDVAADANEAYRNWVRESCADEG